MQRSGRERAVIRPGSRPGVDVVARPSGGTSSCSDATGCSPGDADTALAELVRRLDRALAHFAADLRTDSGDADVVLLGGVTAYTQEDPVEVLRQEGYVDLGTEFDEGRYSDVFDGLSGSLDHARATAELTGKVTDLAHWNINAVESVAYQYTGDPALYAADPYRSSDHDPLVVGIDLEESCQGPFPR